MVDSPPVVEPPLHAGRPPPPRFDSKSCRVFFDAWQAVTGGRTVPQSSEFLDHAPTDLMPYTFIHDVVADGLVVRFMGTGLVQRWRHDLTGQYFGAELAEPERQKLWDTGHIIVTHPCGMRQLGRLASSLGRVVSFEAVALPLFSDDDRPARLVMFSQILDVLGEKEHSSDLAASGSKHWIDLGCGTPAVPPPI